MGMLLFDPNPGGGTFQVRIKVFGVGGGGCNAIDTMILQGMQKVSFVAVNTDHQCLTRSQAHKKLQIGTGLTGGLGAGANPLVGRQAAEESLDKILEAMEDMDICIVIAGMGGGTGTGAAPIIAKTARERGKMVIAFVTTPFGFEGKHRHKNAMGGLDELRESANTLIVVPNEKLFDMITEDTTLVDAFKKVDIILMEAVRSLTRMILEPSMINLDFADVRTVMSIAGQSVISFGEGMGVHRALNSVDAALSNVLVESNRLKSAKGLLVNIVGGPDLTLHEVTKSVRKLQGIIHPDANIIFGANVDPAVGDKVMVTLIATGIEDSASEDPPRVGFYQAIEPEDKRENEKQNRFHKKYSEDRTEEPQLTFDPLPQESEDDLDVPTYLRRNKRYQGSTGFGGSTGQGVSGKEWD